MTGRLVWKNLLFFSLGLTLGASLCMKLVESDFEGFSILGLELGYSRDKITSIFQNMNNHQADLLRFNLWFDFAFMAGIYLLIASLCMLARYRARVRMRVVLLTLAILQIAALICDVTENLFLLRWSYGAQVPGLGTYHFFVWAKWILALTGILFALPVLLRKRKAEMLKSHFTV